MNRRRQMHFAMALLLTVGMFIKCFATETVVKMATNGTGVHSPAFTLTNSYGPTVGTREEAMTHTFLVYTTSEVDGMVQTLTQNLSRDQQEITTLKAEIKTLSDANDALTKRLNDVEENFKKKDQPK